MAQKAQVLVKVAGNLVTWEERPYSFTDRQTGEQVEGVTRLLYLAGEPGEPMSVVKFRADDVEHFSECIEAVPGSRITLNATCEGPAIFDGRCEIEDVLPFDSTVSL